MLASVTRLHLLLESPDFIPSYLAAILTHGANTCPKGCQAPPRCCISIPTNADVHRWSWGLHRPHGHRYFILHHLPFCPLANPSNCQGRGHEPSCKVLSVLPTLTQELARFPFCLSLYPAYVPGNLHPSVARLRTSYSMMDQTPQLQSLGHHPLTQQLMSCFHTGKCPCWKLIGRVSRGVLCFGAVVCSSSKMCSAGD